MNYSVGLPVRNEENTLESSINSILCQSQLPQEILVCVNGSEDRTMDIVTHLSNNESKVNILTSKPGKPNAWNEIVKQVNNNHILFTDGDVTLNETAAENLLNELVQNPKLAVVGGSRSYRKPAKKYETFLSKYSGIKWDIPFKNDFIPGQLYMANLENLLSQASKNNIELMPEDIINEDGLIEAIVRFEDSFEIIESAYCNVTPALTIYDWITREHRILVGIDQIAKQYSHLNPGIKKKIEKIENLPQPNRSLFSKLLEIEKIAPRLILRGQDLVKRYMRYKIKNNPNPIYNNQWAEVKSTKIPHN